MPDRRQCHRHHERGALLPAARAGALDQLALLDGTRHRAEVVPDDDLPAVSAHRRARPLRLVERVRELRRTCSSVSTASTTRRRSGGTSGRTRRSARWSSGSATCRRAPRRPSRSRRVIQAIVVKLYKLYTQNMGFRLYRRALIEENKWRAARWGVDGKLIDFGKKSEVPMRDLALELLAFVDDVVDELGSREHVNYVHTILQRRHQRRSAAARLPRDRRPASAVVQHVVQETRPAAMAVCEGRGGWVRLGEVDSHGKSAVAKSSTCRWSSGCCAAGSSRFRRRSSTRVNELGRTHGVTAEIVKLGGTKMGEPPRYRVIVDRISHEVEYYRGVPEARRAAGHLRHQQPVLVDGGRQVLQLRGGAASSASRSRRRCCCRRRRTRRTSTSRPSRCATSSTRSTGTGCSTTSAARRS